MIRSRKRDTMYIQLFVLFEHTIYTSRCQSIFLRYDVSSLGSRDFSALSRPRWDREAGTLLTDS